MAAHRLAKTAAARMLSDGLKTAASEKALSLREAGRRLGYKQPVVLSHMASGRVPIPIDRAVDIAAEVGLPAKAFLEAVLQQRHPDVDWTLLATRPDPLITELERVAGKPLNELSAAHIGVLRDVVRDAKPEERWLAVPEISAVQLLREIFPHLRSEGLSLGDQSILRACAELLKEQDD